MKRRNHYTLPCLRLLLNLHRLILEYNDNPSESDIRIVQALATLIPWCIDVSHSFLLYVEENSINRRCSCIKKRWSNHYIYIYICMYVCMCVCVCVNACVCVCVYNLHYNNNQDYITTDVTIPLVVHHYNGDYLYVYNQNYIPTDITIYSVSILMHT